MKFTDLTLINLILAIAIFILVLGLASYSLNVHEKLTEIFEEDSSAEDEDDETMTFSSSAHESSFSTTALLRKHGQKCR